MNAQGLSLFQGADSLRINTSFDREEEAEALEDEKRRHEELGNLLENAFDDLNDDEETTIDSTTNFHVDLPEMQHNHRNNNNYNNEQQEQYNDNGAAKFNYDAEMHKLKMLLESKTHECENIKQMANDEYKKRDELQKRLLITEAELDRALSAKNNTHELLVECKEKCSNLENTIENMRDEKKSLEEEVRDLLGKLETTQTLLGEAQHKYNMVERDMNKHGERNFELRRKQLEEQYRAKIDMMQQQMDQLTKKLEKKSTELESMNARYNALQNSHESMLLDKTSKISDLNHALNEAQKQIKELLQKPDYFQENVRLKNLVASLELQVQTLENTISTLKNRLESTTAELDVMDSLLHQHNLEDSTHILNDMQRKVVGSTPLNTVDRVGSLKEELFRALASLKSKREELRKMQQTVDEQKQQISALKAAENKSMVLMTQMNEEKTRQQQRLKALEAQFEELRLKAHNESLNNSKIELLQEEFKQLRLEKQDLERNYNKLALERDELEFERKQLDAQLKNVEVDLEELKQEHESMKLNYEQIVQENQTLRSRAVAEDVQLELERHKFLLKDALAECDRLKNLYVEISNAKEMLVFEVDKLRSMDSAKELQEQREKVANLTRALHLAEVKTCELTKILENEKLCHERDLAALKEKMDQQRKHLLEQQSKETQESNCTKCIDYMAEITKLEIQNLKLNNMSSVSKQASEALTEELKQSKALIKDLQDKLKICAHQDELIKELKIKAKQFEDYVKNHSTASEQSTSPRAQPPSRASTGTMTTPPPLREAIDKCVATAPELEKAEINKIEARLREEMAKVFAAELKRCQIRLRQSEEKIACLQHEYGHASNQLQQRKHEVELLKQAILGEREQMAELLKEKDEQYGSQLQKQYAIIQKCGDELKLRKKRIEELTKEMTERQSQIEAERQSMKAVMAQWEEQRKTIDEIEKEWKDKLDEIQLLHEKSLAHWESKYNSAKRTAANYKRYAEDKEAHMLKEYERLKFEYNTSLTKVEVRMKEALERRKREAQSTTSVDTEKLPSSNATTKEAQSTSNDMNKENEASNN